MIVADTLLKQAQNAIRATKLGDNAKTI